MIGNDWLALSRVHQSLRGHFKQISFLLQGRHVYWRSLGYDCAVVDHYIARISYNRRRVGLQFSLRLWGSARTLLLLLLIFGDRLLRFAENSSAFIGQGAAAANVDFVIRLRGKNS